MRRRRLRASVVEPVRIGSVTLAQPVMTASGTAGHAAELAPYMDLSAIGAVVVKSLYHSPWPGNPAPRVHPLPSGMINAVGLQGPGIEEWIARDLPALEAAGATVVASIWGRSVDDYARGASMLASVAPRIAALEVNLSCPNLEGRGGIIAHDVDVSARVVGACRVAGLPMWAKLSPNTDRIVEVATLVNTVLGMALDPDTGRPALGNGGGGLSGRAIHPVAVRAVHDVRAAHADLPIVGVGGVADGWSAAELIMAGADAVQVGTATFADPAAPFRVAADLESWLRSHGHSSPSAIRGLAHR